MDTRKGGEINDDIKMGHPGHTLATRDIMITRGKKITQDTCRPIYTKLNKNASHGGNVWGTEGKILRHPLILLSLG